MIRQDSLEMWHANGELIQALNSSGVRYLVVGGVAVHFYVRDRDFDDLDLLVEKTPGNVDKLVSGSFEQLRAEGHETAGLRDRLVQSSPCQVPLKALHHADIVTPGNDFDFEAHWEASEHWCINLLPVRIVSKSHLMQMKRGSDREKDQEDLRLLDQE